MRETRTEGCGGGRWRRDEGQGDAVYVISKSATLGGLGFVLLPGEKDW